MVSEPNNDGFDALDGAPEDAHEDRALEAAAEEVENDILVGLNHKQSMAIMALMGESSIERAAQKVGVSDRTLHRWLNQPAFQQAYRQARRQAFNQAVGLVVKYAPLAVSTLVQTMADKDAPHHAKVSAATAILKYGREGLELDDIAARLENIEANLNLQPPGGRFTASRN